MPKYAKIVYFKSPIYETDFYLAWPSIGLTKITMQNATKFILC